MKRLYYILMVLFMALAVFADLPTCPTCKGDANGDGAVTGADVMEYYHIMGSVYPYPDYNPCLDFNEDGAITGADISGFIAVFGTICP